MFLAEEALEMGLVNRVVPADELLGTVRAYARELAENCSPAAMATIKQEVYRHYELHLASALADANRLMAETLSILDPSAHEPVRLPATRQGRSG